MFKHIFTEIRPGGAGEIDDGQLDGSEQSRAECRTGDHDIRQVFEVYSEFPERRRI